MKITVLGQAADVEVIRELLSPWNVSFTSFDQAEVAIVYNKKYLETKKTIVIPSDSSDFMKWIKDIKSRVMKKPGERVFVATTSQKVLTFTPQILYSYDGLVKSAFEETPPTAAALNEDLVFLTLDIIKEYNKILDETLNAKSSTLYNVFTGLPVPYTLAPKQLRDLFMREHRVQENLTLCDKLPLDALRFILVKAIEKLTNKKLHKKTWNGKKYACLITHDVDTKDGLLRSVTVKKLEEKYDVPSAWYLPSAQYPLDQEIVAALTNNGEVGSHDTKHDGRLYRLSGKKLADRLSHSKKILEKMVGGPVAGFRAPLLQHNSDILSNLKDCGYQYDSSIPTWEVKHPRTMRSHGIGTVFPTRIEGMKELPITIMQDHQLLHVLDCTPKEAIETWLSNIAVIKELGGSCVLLSHPEYNLLDTQGLPLYEELLNTIAFDREMLVGLPNKICDIK